MNQEYNKKQTQIFEQMPISATEAINRILEYADFFDASDIHLDPTIFDTSIRLRIDGELELSGSLPARLHEETISRLKILSGVRTDVHAVPQDGRWRTNIGRETYNIRISFMPTYHGENAVLRLLTASVSKQDSFASLGFNPEQVAVINHALIATSGLILVTGPTGSGKTTTLRVCLGLKASEPISVMTLEDPVEYEVPNVRHVHIRETYGVTFASGLRSALRQDPDVIMVGEIRDHETAKTAVNTALTGHLVLSTLHTTSAIETILRLRDMGVERYLIAATLKLVVSQRLVRMICHHCLNENSNCHFCRGTGFSGRSVVAEILEVGDSLKDLIEQNESQKKIREYVENHSFRSIREDAAEKVDWGITTHAEVLSVISQ